MGISQQGVKLPRLFLSAMFQIDPHSPFPAQRGLLVKQAQSQVEGFVYLHNPMG